MNEIDCPNPTVMGEETLATLTQLLLEQSSDPNPLLRDITFGNDDSCNATDDDLVEVDIIIEGACFRRVHPEQ